MSARPHLYVIVGGHATTEAFDLRATAVRRRGGLHRWMTGRGGSWSASQLAEATGLYAAWESPWDRRDRCEYDLRALQREGRMARAGARPARWSAT